jgi:hypothetical protein
LFSYDLGLQEADQCVNVMAWYQFSQCCHIWQDIGSATETTGPFSPDPRYGTSTTGYRTDSIRGCLYPLDSILLASCEPVEAGVKYLDIREIEVAESINYDVVVPPHRRVELQVVFAGRSRTHVALDEVTPSIIFLSIKTPTAYAEDELAS